MSIKMYPEIWKITYKKQILNIQVRLHFRQTKGMSRYSDGTTVFTEALRPLLFNSVGDWS